MTNNTQVRTNNRPAGHAPGENRRTTMHRMYQKAKEEGVTALPMVDIKGVYATPSTGNRGMYTQRPGDVQRGCNCQGYKRHHYCKHYAAACVAHGFQVEMKTCPDCKQPAEKLTDAGVCQSCEDHYLSLAYDAHEESRWDDVPDGWYEGLE